MASNLFSTILQRVGAGEAACLALLAASFVVPSLTDNPLAFSIGIQLLIGVMGAFSVYIMLRMNLLSFAVPAFMAIGGYTMAIAARSGITETLVLALMSFSVPALLALPLGALVLRLRGVYFVLVTYILTEIVQLVLFETPKFTGGSNGLTGMPPTTLFGVELGDNRAIFYVSAGLGLLAGVITVALTRSCRQHFSAIAQNEVLAQSLGLVVWHYKALGFAVAAGVAGLAGFALVNMLLTAHPTSFGPGASVTYIAYVIVGGSTAILGPLVGTLLLVSASNYFSISGEYSPGLFGLLIVLSVLLAKDGIAGRIGRLVSTPLRRKAQVPAASPQPLAEKAEVK
jgi:branched-chain amino acid transport system permease protein